MQLTASVGRADRGIATGPCEILGDNGGYYWPLPGPQPLPTGNRGA
jgi:hypothetical protein